MKKLTATLCLTIAVLLGSTFVMVVPIPAEAGALTAVFKAIFDESDKVVKGIDKSADDLANGASKTTDDATSKIEGGDKGYDENIIANRVQREINKKKNKCQSNRWAIVEFPDSNLYSKPKINSTIIGALDKEEKICVLTEEGEWVRTSYGWVMVLNIKKP
ncbi:SH3 domain-containing protein [Rhodospirillales bacterium]|nr:SH3 domain-containing protein [Rhodospirillales bacterium]